MCKNRTSTNFVRRLQLLRVHRPPCDREKVVVLPFGQQHILAQVFKNAVQGVPRQAGQALVRAHLKSTAHDSCLQMRLWSKCHCTLQLSERDQFLSGRGRQTVPEIGWLSGGSGKVQKGRTPASRHALVALVSASNSNGAFRYPCTAIC